MLVAVLCSPYREWRGGHTHTRSTALSPGLPGWAGTRKVKQTWILLKQETVCGSGISWAIRKSASRSRQITTPAPHHSVFTGRMPFLLPNQQCQITEGTGGGNGIQIKISVMRYDTRCYFNMCSKANMSQLNLPMSACTAGVKFIKLILAIYTVIHNYGNPYEKWNIFVARPHLWLQLGTVKPEIKLCETVRNLSTLNTLTYLRTY